MLDPKQFDDISRRIADGLPSGLQTLKGDFEQNVQASLSAALSKLNLVTREEFDVQQAVLMRTREKLRNLEDQVSTLEAELAKTKG